MYCWFPRLLLKTLTECAYQVSIGQEPPFVIDWLIYSFLNFIQQSYIMLGPNDTVVNKVPMLLSHTALVQNQTSV